MRRGLLLAAMLLAGCARSPLPCWTPRVCLRVCNVAARGGAGSTLLADACGCAIDCDLGVCSGTPICAP